MRKLFSVLLVLAIGGCSLFGFDDFSGGADDPKVGDEAGVDGSGDAMANGDGPITTTDGGTDAAPTGPFCETIGADAAVCDDFDTPGTFTGRWTSKDTYLGSLDLVDGAGLAGSRALRFSATPKTDASVGKDARVVLAYQSPTAAAFVDAEVAVKLTSIPSTMYSAGPLYVEWSRSDGGRARVGFLLGGDRVLAVNPTVFLGDGGAVGKGGTNIVTLPLATWTRIRIVVDLTKSPKSLLAYVDGVVKHEQTIDDAFVPDKVNVFVGANYLGTIDGGTAGYDFDEARVSWK